ncbi:flagellar protein FlaG [Geotoga petraea]|jgi:flagellar protein FlaG|uniref:Flagellar protein FlaG n=1 Tax=Geotoga petraea TaxID=28234 RepID=A0A1G6JF32_9BACT|nr:flagellar protein FlaG [Geotoga petraea]MDK2946113.1 flagellar protein FlaG [Geotoga sp.]TGG88186.1 flagellar protein FlaG [Geotoga petraea]SDC16496.1 flagellar protein FlaG [Geotoga petraea]
MEIKDVNSNYVQQSQLQHGKAVVAKEQKPADANDFKKSNEEIENKQVDMDKITDVLKNKLDKIQKLFTGEARFEVNREADMIVVKIINKETEEVVRQIPSEVSVKLAKALNDLEGILFDEEA